MAIERRFTGQPLQVDDTPENLARITRIADGWKISKAEVVRRALHGGGLDAIEAQFQSEKVPA